MFIPPKRQAPLLKKLSFWKAVRGFSLTEIMLSSLILGVVILIAWSGLMAALNMSHQAQALTARKVEINRAIDLLANEIRQAQSINQSGTMIPDGSSISLEQVASNGGVDLSNLGSYGEIALYLELPFTTDAPEVCPTGTDNAGNPPIGPQNYDPVVYDIRDAADGWLPPKVVTRYGRLPDSQGMLDPCTNPLANDIVADSLTDQASATCTQGFQAGLGGFQTCTHGETVDLLFKSAIEGAHSIESETAVSKRSLGFQPTGSKTWLEGHPSCPDENYQVSLNDLVPVDLTFSNQRDQAVKLYWIDYAGVRQFYNELQPNESILMNTFITHPWVITDAGTEECINLVMPDLQTSSFNII